MTKNQKIIIAAALVILSIFAFAIYSNFFQAMKEPEMPDGGYNIIAAPTVLEKSDELDSVFGLDTPSIDPNRFDDEHIANMKTDMKTETHNYGVDFSVDMERLFGSDNKYEYSGISAANMDLLRDVESFDDSALTVTLDNIDIRAGMTVGDITDYSYWYTVRENDIVNPGAATFVCLENDYWSSDEFKLTDERTAHNGDIVLWVHNYSDIQLPVIECVIYKIQINYMGCYDQFYVRPDVSYRDEYFIGSKSFPDSAYSITSIMTDKGVCTRYTYGDISGCQVLLDENDNGLMGIIISYNEFYGPEFDKGR